MNLIYVINFFKILDKSVVSGIKTFQNKTENQKIVLLPRYGFCKEISEYNAKSEIWIQSNASSIQIFLTDPRLRSYTTLDYSSQIGDIITSITGIILIYNKIYQIFTLKLFNFLNIFPLKYYLYFS